MNERDATDAGHVDWFANVLLKVTWMIGTSKPHTNNNTKRQKALPPTLREKTRYVAFEIISESPLHGNACKDLVGEIHKILGVFQGAEAGLIALDYDEATQKGVLRTCTTGLQSVRAAFGLITSIQGIRAIVRSTKTSGMLHNVKLQTQTGTRGG